ncbi:thioredoxin family protein [Fulvivirga aurantia]|uniref:thioredoxin family protein n=1 Tax=Fulvivirga aurantia TaxID=2529383 RepID=UPI001626BDAB|nr:thioredoxin family protein [Fulvivirga aurantia]
MKYILILFLLTSINQSGISQEVEMITDWNKATELANQENKQILIILTGSDWCTPCKKMDKKVINQPEFQEYASQRLVLFLIDLTKEVVFDSKNPTNKDYEVFKKKYETNELPSLILTDTHGKKIKVLEGKKFDLENVMNQLSNNNAL